MKNQTIRKIKTVAVFGFFTAVCLFSAQNAKAQVYPLKVTAVEAVILDPGLAIYEATKLQSAFFNHF